ncbi:MAG: hypothetical protein JWN25_2338 [Verrucomicrobiales bacterium]|nr:hypothetical protein [Verrucomicrobiales bacterium]
MNTPAKNPYQEHILIIRRHLNMKDAGLQKVLLAERLVIVVLCCILILLPSMFIRYVFGIISRRARKIAVEVYVLFKTVLAIGSLSYGLWHKHWFVWLALIMLIDLFAFIFALILLRGFWRSPVSLNRSIILLGFNFFEYTAWFAGLYLFYACLLTSGKIVTDPSLALYFSIVTAATIGYGDIVPSGYGHTLAIFQIVASLGYLAAVVAYFIGGLERQDPDVEPPNAQPREEQPAARYRD